MATPNEQRVALAAACSTVDGVDVRDYQIKSAVRGDGWVTVGRVVPSDFTRNVITFSVPVVLGPDIVKAETAYELWASQLINAATDLGGFDVSVQPITITVGSSEQLALELTVSLEVTTS